MASPTSFRERQMAEKLAANEKEDEETTPPETAEETVDRQDRNLRQIRITYRSYRNSPDLRKVLEKQFSEGRNSGEFPASAELDESVPKQPASQAQVRARDNATMGPQEDTRRGNPPGNQETPVAPNLQLTSLSAETSLNKGVDALAGYVEQSRDVINDLIRQTTESTEAAVVSHGKAAAAVLLSGAAKGEEAKAAGEIEAAGAIARERVLNIANLDTRVADNQFSKMLSERMQIRGQREELGKEIDARQAVGLFDNPLMWLINQTVLPGQVAQYNNMATNENNITHNLTSLQGEVRAQENLDMGATADQFAKRATFAANAEVAQATAKAEEIRAGSSALVAQKVMTIAGLRERQLSHMETLSKWRIALEDKQPEKEKREETLENERDMDRRTRVVGTLIGNNIASFRWLKGQGKDVQEAWAKRAGTLTLGDDLYEANEFVKRFGDLNNMRVSGTGELADMFKAFDTEVTKRSQNIQNTWATLHPEQASKPPKATEARHMAADQMQAEWEQQRDRDMFKADQINPYKINHKKEYLAYRGDKTNPVYALAQDAYKNGLLIDDKILVGAVSDLVTSGLMKPREAASALTEYYADAVTRNNNDRNIKNMGMDKQEGYKVRFEGAAAPVDLLNTVATENYFTRESTVAKAKATGFMVPAGMDVQEYPGFSGKGTGTYFLKYPEKKEPTKDILLKSAKERLGTPAGASK